MSPVRSFVHTASEQLKDGEHAFVAFVQGAADILSFAIDAWETDPETGITSLHQKQAGAGTRTVCAVPATVAWMAVHRDLVEFIDIRDSIKEAQEELAKLKSEEVEGGVMAGNPTGQYL